jgi:hypothetical protein
MQVEKPKAEMSREWGVLIYPSMPRLVNVVWYMPATP